MSSLNWFDAFRDNSGPLLYHNNNRISATYDDVLNILIYICFVTLFVAFLIISPGIRKEVSVLLTDFVDFRFSFEPKNFTNQVLLSLAFLYDHMHHSQPVHRWRHFK